MGLAAAGSGSAVVQGSGLVAAGLGWEAKAEQGWAEAAALG